MRSSADSYNDVDVESVLYSVVDDAVLKVQGVKNIVSSELDGVSQAAIDCDDER